MPQEPDTSLEFLTAAEAEGHHNGPCVVIVRTREEFARWLRDPAPGVEWLQVEGLIGDPEAWALAAQGSGQLPLDVILSDPATEFSALYRLVDARIVRPIRVTIPASLGFMKALRLAASLQIPVRLLPGQPDTEALAELTEAAHFYLHDPMVDAAVEPFHSLFGIFRGAGETTLWNILEQNPAIFASGPAILPRDFVETHLAGLLDAGAECATCRWQPLCAGYFKSPDPTYACAGVKQLFASLEAAAAEITRDLAEHEAASQS